MSRFFRESSQQGVVENATILPETWQPDGQPLVSLCYPHRAPSLAYVFKDMSFDSAAASGCSEGT